MNWPSHCRKLLAFEYPAAVSPFYLSPLPSFNQENHNPKKSINIMLIQTYNAYANTDTNHTQGQRYTGPVRIYIGSRSKSVFRFLIYMYSNKKILGSLIFEFLGADLVHRTGLATHISMNEHDYIYRKTYICWRWHASSITVWSSHDGVTSRSSKLQFLLMILLMIYVSI